ncbi:MAG: ATP-dependent sacrificial sulfur transferase LarE [Planctomycetes bacterium]|nr:ATP-dependent sacrificial sulfur transferase LarE [Planctomycetota bacterium]MBL7037395.1 ATP-dependent sacrificial sulfur transferase LarE [Pirellulaceae bacterium]
MLNDLDEKRERLLDLIRSFQSCAVAFSAGVDSTVVAKAAQLALGDRAVAVTGVSPSLAERELDEARRLAELIGIRHELISTEEFSNVDYVRNAPDRCYHCKSELFTQMQSIAPRLNVEVILSGANVDDADDYRPGAKAATEHQVRSPLAECGINKDEIRQLAAQWDLPIWDKPAMPCLSSRVAYGEEVTPERLEMVDRGEQFLRDQGFPTVRVRYHRGDVARVEVPAVDIAKLCEDDSRQSLAEHLKGLGFRFVTLDLEGFRSGSLNTLVPIETRTNS